MLVAWLHFRDFKTKNDFFYSSIYRFWAQNLSKSLSWCPKGTELRCTPITWRNWSFWSTICVPWTLIMRIEVKLMRWIDYYWKRVCMFVCLVVFEWSKDRKAIFLLLGISILGPKRPKSAKNGQNLDFRNFLKSGLSPASVRPDLLNIRPQSGRSRKSWSGRTLQGRSQDF